MMDFNKFKIVPLNDDIVKEICSWKYESPYDIYNLGDSEYLLDRSTWGTEQFALVDNNDVIAQLACQMQDEDMWVGWSLRPELCGKGYGSYFVDRCINELVRLKKYDNKYIFLKVIDWNQRAIKSYEKIGFRYYKSIVREVESTDESINFHIMIK